jgi:hypothetical protein
MSWIGDRKDTLLDAFTLRRVIAVPILVATVTAVIHGSAALSKIFAHGDGNTLLGAPSWYWGIIAGILLIFWFLLEHANRLRLELKPKLKVSFNPDVEGIVRTPTVILLPNNQRIDDLATYVRITLTCLSGVTVKNCAAFLTKIEKKLPGAAEYSDVPINGSLPMLPSPIDVHPRVPIPVDFLKAGRYENKLGLSFEWPLRLLEAFDDIASYRMTFEVIGEGIAHSVAAEINWTGRWDKISGKEIADRETH